MCLVSKPLGSFKIGQDALKNETFSWKGLLEFTGFQPNGRKNHKWSQWHYRFFKGACKGPAIISKVLVKSVTLFFSI